MQYALSFCEVVEKDDTYTFTGPCIVTGKLHSVTVKGPDLYRYHQGMKIQDAFPYLSVCDREFLMSGYSPEGWNKIFGGEVMNERN